MKRLFDVFFSTLGILFLLPLYVLISCCILIDSEGGVLYKQERIGKNKAKFKIFKFRTMYSDSFAKGSLTVGDRDSRVTNVGYFLRKYKLDELPQLFNVFKGEMSFVGPRPEIEKFTLYYNDEQDRIFVVKPGITDYASIKYRNEAEILAKAIDPEKTYIENIMPEKLKLNLLYVDDNSVLKDIKIIVDTFKAIIIN